jgi:hypothetical protein
MIPKELGVLSWSVWNKGHPCLDPFSSGSESLLTPVESAVLVLKDLS